MSKKNSDTPRHDPQEIYRTKVNLETSRISWKELQRHFASGSVVTVSDKLDLVEVAYQMSQDNKELVAQWLADGLIGRTTDEEAAAWYEADADMWAVVISPWVLVQRADVLN